MDTTAKQPEQDDTQATQGDGAPTAQDDAQDMTDVPAAAGGKDDTAPAQGEGEASSY